MNIFWWIFGLYLAPAIIVALFMDDSLFNKDKRWSVFMPFKNLWEALIIVLICIAVTLISFGEFCEDMQKSFKKHFC